VEEATENRIAFVGSLQYSQCGSEKYGSMELDFLVGEIWPGTGRRYQNRCDGLVTKISKVPQVFSSGEYNFSGTMAVQLYKI
jgi:hypothetical protein